MNGAIQKVVNEQLKNNVARTYVFTKYEFQQQRKKS